MFRVQIPIIGGMVVVTNQLLPNKPLLTCELSTKWYHLVLVHSDGTIEKVDPTPDEVGYKDNTYNPTDLVAYAEKRDYVIDKIGFEIIVGRWEIETMEHYMLPLY